MIVRAKGAEIHYTTRGRGPACVIPTAIGTKPYERQTAGLAEHFTLVYVDPRGSGRSTGAAADLTFDVLAEDLEAVRGDLGLEHVAVLGHSIAGALALEYARRCPASVSHVIAVGTPPFGDLATLMAKATAFFQAQRVGELRTPTLVALGRHDYVVLYTLWDDVTLSSPRGWAEHTLGALVALLLLHHQQSELALEGVELG